MGTPARFPLVVTGAFTKTRSAGLVWSTHSHFWSIVTNDEKSKAQQATVPAAALLFQAPEFRAPAPSKTNESGEGRAKDRSGNDQENAAASRSGGGGRGNRRGGQARSDNSRQPARKAEEETQKKTEKTKESAAASGKSNKGQQAQKTKPKKEEANKASEGGRRNAEKD